MAATALQSILHNLQVGVAMSVDLKNYMTVAGTVFSLVGTSRAYNLSALPPGLSLSSNGVLSGTPTQAGVTTLKIRAARGTRDAEASWAARAAGAYNTDRFDTSTSIDQALATGRNFNIAWDTAKKRSGNGSLYLHYPLGTNNYAKFSFSTRVAQLMTGGAGGAMASDRGFAPGEEFYLQFGLYTDRNFVQYPWTQWGKIFILDSVLWSGNLNHKHTANEQEIVVIPGHGWPHGYSNGNEGWAWLNGTWPGGVGLQPSPLNAQGRTVYQTNLKNTGRALNGDNPGLPSGAGPAWTAAQQERAANGYTIENYTALGHPDGRPDPIAGGAPFAQEAWHTFLLYCKLATEPIVTDVDGRSWLTSGGQLKIWMAQDGQDYQLLYNNTNFPLRCGDGITTGPNYFWKTDAPHSTESPDSIYSRTTVFSALHPTNLFFGIDMSGVPVHHQQWMTEFICSPNFIQAPDYDGTGSYRTSDAIVTIKVT